MKKILIVALGVLFTIAMQAAPPADVGKPMSDQVLLLQADTQPMVADFVFMDYSIETIATAPETSYEIYQAMPAEVRNQVYELAMPVFRLCKQISNAMGGQVISQEFAQKNLPPNRLFRTHRSVDSGHIGRLAQMVEQAV